MQCYGFYIANSSGYIERLNILKGNKNHYNRLEVGNKW